MLKIMTVIEKAKNDTLVKRTGEMAIYRYKQEKKIRFNSYDILRGSSSPLMEDLIEKLLILKRNGDRWEIDFMSDDARGMIFKEALKDAEKLYYGGFMPELDNLESNTLGSVLFKISHEWDLLDEGELTDIPKRTANSWARKSAEYFRKYRDLLEDEADYDRSMYDRF